MRRLVIDNGWRKPHDACLVALKHMLTCNGGLTELSLRHFAYDDATIGAGLCANQSLVSVDLHGATWRHSPWEHTVSLTGAIRDSRCLRELSLCLPAASKLPSGGGGLEWGPLFHEGLAYNRSIHKLRLVGGVGDKGSSTLSMALQQPLPLRCLILEQNSIRPRGCRSLSHGIGHRLCLLEES